MPAFECDYSYDLREFGSVVVDAIDKQEAEDKAYDYVIDAGVASNISIDEIREVPEING